ncbi:NAD(P)-dependent oxidoreductase [Priestia aryabhattai]|uniref:NAD(P)-dependent oxidoreductase n=1 Tax=Priestia aryabhattai TaxID=412384 RepID=UPI003D29B2BD
MHTLGWIGLGHMGTPMAKNLLQAGYKMNVYNRSLEKTASLVESGATKLNSPKEIVEQSNIIFIMLSDAKAVHSVLTEENGVLNAIKEDKTIINMSTISPEESVSFAQLIEAKSGTYVDAPVSGSVGAAIGGQLVILAGGEKKAVEISKPYFNLLGKETIHFGSTGKGSSAKLAINLLLGIIGQGIGETLLFAEKSGLDKEKVLEMISQSGMNTPLFQGKKEMYRKEEFPSAFMLELMSKDLGLVKKATDHLDITLPLAETTYTTYHSAKENGKAKLDMAAVYVELRDQNTE